VDSNSGGLPDVSGRVCYLTKEVMNAVITGAETSVLSGKAPTSARALSAPKSHPAHR